MLVMWTWFRNLISPAKEQQKRTISSVYSKIHHIFDTSISASFVFSFYLFEKCSPQVVSSLTLFLKNCFNHFKLNHVTILKEI
mmetsp:Transcript_28530/g.37327  ORF Transcript_28530/g.37327 Transcript_28530/m.37327 type:complete len:83 (+) Transcript_28530:161-409(+)